MPQQRGTTRKDDLCDPMRSGQRASALPILNLKRLKESRRRPV
jgi:hypothetical protein